MTLYELSEQYQNLLAMMDEIPEDAFADTMEALEGEVEEKIDGIVAAIMALDRCIRNQVQPQGSVYDERGLLIF